MKLFTAIGSVLEATTQVIINTASVATTTTGAVDNIIKRSASQIDRGFDAIELPLDNMLADLKCDNIVDNAKRDIRIAEAEAEASTIRATLAKPVRAKRTTKSTAKKTTK